MTIVYAILICLAMYDIIKLIAAYFVMREERFITINRYKKVNRILLIIPVYREQLRIKDFVDSMERIEYPKENLRILFCTTEKESRSLGDTESVINKIIEGSHLRHNYSICRYPSNNGNMAEQVNYAYNTEGAWADIIGIYNADSKLDGDVLMYVNDKFNESAVDYLQQRSIYNNYNENNLFATGYIYFQSMFEIKENVLRDFKNNGINICGRGMFVRKSAIKAEIYPTDFFCEDMALAFRIVSSSKKIGGIPYLEENEPPICLKDIINQQYVWFHTAIRVKSMYDYGLSFTESAVNRLLIAKLLNRIKNNIMWVSATGIFITLSVYNPVFIAVLYGYCIIICVLLNHMFKLRKKSRILLDSVGLMIYLYAYSLGSWKVILISLARRFGIDIEYIKYKTPRGKRKC